MSLFFSYGKYFHEIDTWFIKEIFIIFLITLLKKNLIIFNSSFISQNVVILFYWFCNFKHNNFDVDLLIICFHMYYKTTCYFKFKHFLFSVEMLWLMSDIWERKVSNHFKQISYFQQNYKFHLLLIDFLIFPRRLWPKLP